MASVAWAAGNGQHNMSEHITPSSPASQEYLDGIQKMHDGMMKGVMAQDPDVAFAESMTAHHEDAIEMAKTQLKYGQNQEMRKLHRGHHQCTATIREYSPSVSRNYHENLNMSQEKTTHRITAFPFSIQTPENDKLHIMVYECQTPNSVPTSDSTTLSPLREEHYLSDHIYNCYIFLCLLYLLCFFISKNTL